MSFLLHSENLQDTWLDAYGHLNEAYYLVAFSNATWALQDHLELGPAYTNATGNALYTVETHLRYLREVRAPATLNVNSLIFGFDRKRMHIGHVLIVDGEERATFECVLIHVGTKTGRSHPFSEEQSSALSSLPLDSIPAWSGSRVGL